MKKTIIFIAIIVVILCAFKTEKIIIPKEAIRFRVIANSNSIEDQYIKNKIVERLNNSINEIEIKQKDIATTRKNIQESIPILEKTVEETLKDLQEEIDYTIEYGMNYFPEKEYKGVSYSEGEYESLIIKLGEGKGDNFWCVLFPPLCLLEVEDTKKDKIEYKSYIKELIDKYF